MYSFSYYVAKHDEAWMSKCSASIQAYRLALIWRYLAKRLAFDFTFKFSGLLFCGPMPLANSQERKMNAMRYGVNIGAIDKDHP